MERYPKDEKLTGIYVKRCKCGARPYSDEVAIGSRPTWIACNCGRQTKSFPTLEKAIEAWNSDDLDYGE